MELSPAVHALVDLALEEDLGRGDLTSEAILDETVVAKARFQAKQPLVLAGLPVAALVFRKVDPGCAFVQLHKDGDAIAPGDVVATVEGSARAILAAERTALNFLQRLSGIATHARRFVAAVAGTRAAIVDTRKTAPGFRALDKHAVRMGGARNHRHDLAAGVLVKDNHIAAAGSVRLAVERARAHAPHLVRVEVEVTTSDMLAEALAAGADIVLLDNFTPDEVRVLVERIAGRALVEVSGGITLDTVRAYAEAGADLISVGALTHSPPAADLSLELG